MPRHTLLSFSCPLQNLSCSVTAALGQVPLPSSTLALELPVVDRRWSEPPSVTESPPKFAFSAVIPLLSELRASKSTQACKGAQSPVRFPKVASGRFLPGSWFSMLLADAKRSCGVALALDVFLH